jgi:hypothetical protein
MQQSKAYVIKNATRNLKATMAARKAEYAAYRYGTSYASGATNKLLEPNNRKGTTGAES